MEKKSWTVGVGEFLFAWLICFFIIVALETVFAAEWMKPTNMMKETAGAVILGVVFFMLYGAEAKRRAKKEKRWRELGIKGSKPEKLVKLYPFGVFLLVATWLALVSVSAWLAVMLTHWSWPVIVPLSLVAGTILLFCVPGVALVAVYCQAMIGSLIATLFKRSTPPPIPSERLPGDWFDAYRR